MTPDFLLLCQQRKSVRAFLPDPVSDEDWQYIMQCVNLAPSAVNFQPWHFYIVQDAHQLSLLQACYPREWFATAPACIIACKDCETQWVRREDGKAHGDIDVAIAVEHLCLAAAERGLGTCWVCNFSVSQLAETFPLPLHHQPVALIPIGHPVSDDANPIKKRKSLDEIITFL